MNNGIEFIGLNYIMYIQCLELYGKLFSKESLLVLLLIFIKFQEEGGELKDGDGENDVKGGIICLRLCRKFRWLELRWRFGFFDVVYLFNQGTGGRRLGSFCGKWVRVGFLGNGDRNINFVGC